MKQFVPTLIIDLDNTLCECGIHYLEAERDWAAEMERHVELPAAVCKEVLNSIDHAALMLPNAFNRERMYSSYRAATAAMAAFTGRMLMPMEWSDRFPDHVFNAPYALYPDVKPTLLQLREAGWRLVLLTKGDRGVQQRKIDINGLAPFFDAVHIVPQKSAGVLAEIVAQEHVDARTSWVIGDSVRDDIHPAIACDLNTIEVLSDDRHWKYDDGETISGADHAVKAFREVLAALAYGSRKAGQEVA